MAKTSIPPRTPQLELRQRLTVVLDDMQKAGMADGEAMFYLGGFVVQLCNRLTAKDWTVFKKRLPAGDYHRLLTQIQAEGNKLVAAGKREQAYALQALAISLVASRQDDAVLHEGEALLDRVIYTAALRFRQHAPKPRKTN